VQTSDGSHPRDGARQFVASFATAHRRPSGPNGSARESSLMNPGRRDSSRRRGGASGAANETPSSRYWHVEAHAPEMQSSPASHGWPAAPLVQMPELSPPM
jgi:hypothetical protein